MPNQEKAETKKKVKIEFEEVTLKIPKAIMKLLRDNEKSLEETAIEYLEHSLVDMVRADIETQDCFVPTPRGIVERYNLDPVFKEITGITIFKA
jgi:hypothetical protein